MSLTPELAAFVEPIRDEVVAAVERDLAPTASAGRPPLVFLDGLRAAVEADVRRMLVFHGRNLGDRPADLDALQARVAERAAAGAIGMVRDMLELRSATPPPES